MRNILSLFVSLFIVNLGSAQYPYYYRHYHRPYYHRPYYISPFNPVPPFKGLIAPKPGDFTPEFTKHVVPSSFWSKEYLERNK